MEKSFFIWVVHQFQNWLFTAPLNHHLDTLDSIIFPQDICEFYINKLGVGGPFDCAAAVVQGA